MAADAYDVDSSTGGHRTGQTSTLEPFVVAVLVLHDGEAYLPRCLRALRAQTRSPDYVVAVDVGSRDRSAQLLAASGVADQTVTLPRDAGFATAVHAGVDAAREASPADNAQVWTWVLHDDCAPQPGALEALLTATSVSPSLRLVGPKVLGWDDPRRLLEVGVSISGSGRRETGLERREQDQGQHDGQRDALAVGSAGALVRRDAWDEVGGYDRSLSAFRDDVDLGWRLNRAGHRVAVVTDAVVHHAEAAASRRRAIVAGGGRVHRVDRASALHVLLANARLATLPLHWLRLAAGTLLRALGFLLGKAPRLAADEIATFSDVLLRPGRLVSARRRRRGSRVVSRHQMRAFFPRPGTQLRQGAESVAALFSARVVTGSGPGLLESGPIDEDAESMLSTGEGWWRRTLRRPGVVLTLVLVLLSLVAWRTLFVGGALFGGSLLPSPTGATDLWSRYAAAFSDVQIGSSVPAPPYLALLAALSTALLGKAPAAVAAILLLAVPAAALTAYLAVGALRLSLQLRLWGAAVYGLSPALLAAVAQGRIGTALVAVLLPPLAVAVSSAVGTREHPGRWSGAATAALLLSACAAFAPVTAVLGAVLALLACVGWARTGGARLRLVAIAVAPAVLLLPWSWRVATDPALLLLEAGQPLQRDPDFAAWQVLAFAPGGPGSAPLAIAGLIGLAVVVALLRAVRRSLVRAGLVVCGVGLAAALVMASVTVTPAWSPAPVTPWPGPALLVATAGGLLAVAVATRGARRRLTRVEFGWRQPVAVLAAVLGLLTPVLLGGWWLVRGAAGPLERDDPQVLPAFVAAAAEQPDRVRTLVLQDRQGRLDYSLLGATSPQLGDVETAPDAGRLTDLSDAVAQVGSGRGGAVVERLSAYAVRYVLLTAPVDPQLETTLDSVPGLVRVANPGDDALWRVAPPAGRLVLRADGAGNAGPVTVLPSGPVSARATVPAGGAAPRILALAEGADRGWVATLDGRALSGQAAGWQQTFALPASSGSLALDYDQVPRRRWLAVQAVLVLVVVVLAVPARRADDDTLDTAHGPARPEVTT